MLNSVRAQSDLHVHLEEAWEQSGFVVAGEPSGHCLRDREEGRFDPRDFSDPKMSGPMRYFDVELPGGTLVRIGGFSHPLLTDIKPVPHIQGGLSAQGKKFCVVVCTFNSFITERLLAGAVDGLLRCGAEKIMVVRVPGALRFRGGAKLPRPRNTTRSFVSVVCCAATRRTTT